MRLAMVMPTYTKKPDLCTMATLNAMTWRPHVDDLIICEDGADPCLGLMKIADLFLYHQNIGVCLNMKQAWEIAIMRGADYVLIMDSDCKLVGGNPRDLCVPGQVAVPTIVQHPDTAFIAPVLCVPRSVSDERGMYDDMNGAHRDISFDAVYGQKVGDLVVKVKSIRVDHIGGATRFDNVGSF